MGVNCYIVTMTIELISIENRSGPRYAAIADALTESIETGALEAGEKLPTHRDLAWQLGVTVGTVTRAYQELDRRGLTDAQVGRGTYVRERIRRGHFHGIDWEVGSREPDPAVRGIAHRADRGIGENMIDFGPGIGPVSRVEAKYLSDTLREIAADPELGVDLLDYGAPGGKQRHREAGVKWFAERGVETTADRVIVTNGAQHGMMAALAASTNAGDRLGVEELSYPGIIALADLLGLKLEPIAIDEDGMRPDAVADALAGGVRTFYIVPTVQNPSCAVMPAERRADIAALIAEHHAILVEDDMTGLLVPDAPPPIATLIPEQTILLTSLSKSVSGGLRVGFLSVPELHREGARMAIRSSCWMATPLPAEVAARWIEDGTALKILEGRRREMAARHKVAREVFDRMGYRLSPGALFAWVQLPAVWNAADFRAEASAQGISVPTQAAFMVGDRGGDLAAERAGTFQSGLRVALGLAPDAATLREQLIRLVGLIKRGPSGAMELV